MILHKHPRARCEQLPQLYESTHLGHHLKARRLCDSCPVAHECMTEALRQRRGEVAGLWPGDGIPHGTWAGLLWDAGQLVSVTP